MVAEALIGADLVLGVFQNLGFEVQPVVGQHRSDLIQAVRLGDPNALQVVCKAFQLCSPVGAFLDPVPAPMPASANGGTWNGGYGAGGKAGYGPGYREVLVACAGLSS